METGNNYSLENLIQEGGEYGKWALNILVGQHSVSSSLPLRFANEKALKLAVLPSVSDFVAELKSQKKDIDFSNPLEILLYIPDSLDDDLLSLLAHKASGELFLSAGSYANPVLTEMRRNPGWRLAEIIATHETIRQSYIIHQQSNSFAFGGDLGNYFVQAYRRFNTIDALLVAGPIWKWRTLNGSTQPVGEKLTEDAVHLLIENLYLHEEGRRRSNTDDSKISTNPNIRRMIRLGNMRSSITDGDLVSRLTRIHNSITAELMVILAGWSKEFSFSELINWLENTQLGINHWQGLGILTAVLGRYPVHDGEISTGEKISFVPPSLHLDSELNKETVVNAVRIGQAPFWQYSFEVLDKLETPDMDNSGRIFYAKNGISNEWISGLSNEISRKVDRNHTNRQQYLSERISLLRYQMADSAADIVNSVSTYNRGDEYRGSGHNTSSSLNAEISVKFPPLFAGNVAYTLGADVCRIYRYDFGNQELDTVQAHYGPVVIGKMDAATCNDIESLGILEAGNSPRLRKHCSAYNVLPTSRSPEGFDGLLSVRFSNRSGVPKTWNTSLPIRAIGRSGVTVPIRVFGRLWGVIEIRGRYPFQLRQSTKTWLEEISSSIGASLLNPWIGQHVTTLVAHASAILDNVNHSETSFHRVVARHLSSMFLCESCFIWHASSGSDEGLVLKDGFVLDRHKERWDELKPKLKKLMTTSVQSHAESGVDSVISHFIRSNKLFNQYDLDFEKGDWSRGVLCKELREIGHRRICLLRLNDEFGEPEGIIWLAGHYVFEGVWESLFPSIIAQLRLVFDIAAGHQKILNEAHTALAHEALGSLDVIGTECESLSEALDFLKDENIERVTGLIAELKVHIERSGGFSKLNVSDPKRNFEYLSNLLAPDMGYADTSDRAPNKAAESLQRIVSNTDRAEAHLKSLLKGEVVLNQFESKSKIDFRAVFKRAMPLDHRYSYVELGATEATKGKRVIWTGSSSAIFVHYFPRAEADFVVQNLIANAIKYNVGKSEVQVGSRERIGSNESVFWFSFSNVGWLIEENETKSIRSWKKRGKYAKLLWPGQGAGAGLAGIVYRLQGITSANQDIEAELIGPLQTILQENEETLISMEHPSIRNILKANPNFKFIGKIAKIRFELKITNTFNIRQR